MIDGFPSIAFQAAVQAAGTLFGVFGFLYSVYAMFSNVSGATGPVGLVRPPIVRSIQVFCRFLAIVIAGNAALSIYAMLRLPLSWPHDVVLAVGSGIVSVAIAGFSLWWAFSKMRY